MINSSQELEFPGGLLETDEEINQGIDYLSNVFGLRYENTLFNEAKNDSINYGGLTIEELLSKAPEIERREKRLNDLGVYGHNEHAGKNWYRNLG